MLIFLLDFFFIRKIFSFWILRKLICFIRNLFYFDIHRKIKFFYNAYISFGNSSILLGNSFILSKFFYFHCYLELGKMKNLSAFWTQIEQTSHCDTVKVKIVGQVTCHFGFASVDNFLMDLSVGQVM
jgi:hypothetical protein